MSPLREQLYHSLALAAFPPRIISGVETLVKCALQHLWFWGSHDLLTLGGENADRASDSRLSEARGNPF